MISEEEDLQYIAEVSQISKIPVQVVEKVIETQTAMILRDLNVKGESLTFLGKIVLSKNKNITFISKNSRLVRMIDVDKLVERLLSELG